MGDEKPAEMRGGTGKCARTDMVKDVPLAGWRNDGVAGLSAAIAADDDGVLRGGGKAIDHQSLTFVSIGGADHGLCADGHG
ncbi:hypothetical protein D3C72_2478920 [compost metagenome]